MIFAVSNNFTNDIEISDMKRFEKELIEYATLNNSDLMAELKTSRDFSKELMQKAAEVVTNFKLVFKPTVKEN